MSVPRKRAYRSGATRSDPKGDPMPRHGFRDTAARFGNYVSDGFKAVVLQRTRLMGEKVHDVEQACAMLREGGGIILQQVRSGRHLDCLTYTKESKLRESFPTDLGKHDYVIVQGLRPDLNPSRW